MPPDPHHEEYDVTFVKDLTNPTRIRLDVHLRDAQGDDGVECIYLNRNDDEPSRKGVENPEDSVAKVHLKEKDYKKADKEIVIGTRVYYDSKIIAGVENISNFSWS
jgi:hypothetical protein